MNDHNRYPLMIVPKYELLNPGPDPAVAEETWRDRADDGEPVQVTHLYIVRDDGEGTPID